MDMSVTDRLVVTREVGMGRHFLGRSHELGDADWSAARKLDRCQPHEVGARRGEYMRRDRHKGEIPR